MSECAEAVSSLLVWFLNGLSAGDWANATVRVFDDRVEDTQRRFFLAVCFPQTGLLMIFLCSTTQDKRISVALHRRMSATSIARVNCLRQDVYDLLTISREHGPTILTYGLQPMPIRFSLAQPTGNVSAASTLCKAVRLSEDARCNIIVVIQDGSRWQANLDFDNGDDLTVACFRTLSMTLTAEAFFHLKVSYVRRWQDTARVIAHKQSFECFRSALSDTLRFPIRATHQIKQDDSWSFLGYSTSRRRFVDDSSLGHLELPDRAEAQPQLPAKTRERPHALLGPALNSLHLLGEDLRQALSTEYLVYTLAPLLCDMALVIRPEWADYWKRTIPDVLDGWPCPLDTSE
jgi:anaphase-promoting complex subunit 1